MTKEEAIKVLEAEKKFLFHGSLSDKHYEPAFDMAIEALKAQAKLDDVSTAYENGYRQGKFEALQWIPVSEKLPGNDDFVIVTVLDERGDTPYRYSDFGWYLNRAKCWIIDDEQRTDVIAWMPLPSSYKGDKS